jgi:cytochrome c oxidase subunit IV
MSSAYAASPDNHGMAEVHGHKINYFMIFGLLIVLTVITVAVATQRFENEFVNVCLALLIATIKATFVARYFMHLKFEGKLIWFIFVVPLLLCVLITCALIPDIGRGRTHAFNDVIGSFEKLLPAEK